MLTPSENRRRREEKKKETCVWYLVATLCVPQVNPHTLLPDTAKPTTVKDVIHEDQYVIAFSAVIVQC